MMLLSPDEVCNEFIDRFVAKSVGAAASLDFHNNDLVGHCQGFFLVVRNECDAHFLGFFQSRWIPYGVSSPVRPEVAPEDTLKFHECVDGNTLLLTAGHFRHVLISDFFHILPASAYVLLSV